MKNYKSKDPSDKKRYFAIKWDGTAETEAAIQDYLDADFSESQDEPGYGGNILASMMTHMLCFRKDEIGLRRWEEKPIYDEPIHLGEWFIVSNHQADGNGGQISRARTDEEFHAKFEEIEDFFKQNNRIHF